MRISVEAHERLQGKLAGMRAERLPWWQHWRDLADFYLPRRYTYLLSERERADAKGRNSQILDATGVLAARTLANGMMNGITSPARPWFKLRLIGFGDDLSHAARVWLDEVERRMMIVLAESNFYNSMAVLYGDLSVFNTASMLIYESPRKVIHCYNPPLGEFYIAQDYELTVDHFAREFCLTVMQLIKQFGEENVSESVANQWKRGGANLLQQVPISCVIEPNDEQDRGDLARSFTYRETYWETGGQKGHVLLRKGYNEFLAVAPRWSTTANDSYGTGPSMDALGDVIQLQHETKKKAQGLDKMISPPILADVSLEHRPTALLPNGVTYANMRNASQPMAQALYTVNPPVGEISQDIAQVQARIRETFHNELFTMISQLDTVRSAAEIDARREEKLVQLGPVLERFENECLDPALARVYAIMQRRGLIPKAPAEVAGASLQVQYTSILSAAQSAVGTAGTERWLQLGGNLVSIWPELREVPDIVEVYRDYGRDVGVPAKNIRSTDQVAQIVQRNNQQQEQQQALDQTGQAAQAAELLSQVDVGGGQNAVQKLLQ